MGVSTIPASGGGGLIPKYAKFTSSGTFTLPDGYGAAKPLVVTVQVIGGGGAGAGDLAVGAMQAGLTVRIDRVDYFGQTHGNFPVNIGSGWLSTANRNFNTNQNGAGGGSGGIAQTQMALTGPLTITVGAAGARNTSTNTSFPNFYTSSWGRGGSNNTGVTSFNVTQLGTGGSPNTNTGGSGGTSTAGSVSATGGVGGAGGSYTLNTNSGTVQFPSDVGINSGNAIGPFNVAPTVGFNAMNSTGGTAGQPAGSAGGATPLLGALAGGSGTNTPVYGAFGVGGIKSDITTSTGVEGTGGGFGSVGASGAVIISYWA